MGLFDLFDSKTDQSSTTRVNLRNMDQLNQGEGELSQTAREAQLGQFQDLQGLLTRGGTEQAGGDIDAARQSQMDLLQALRGAQGGPTAQNVAQGQAFARDIFAPQQEALNQNFEQSETETARLAARLGRSVDDPILRAKLAQSQAQETRMLGAQQGALAAQSAQGFQNQALQMQNQIAQVRGGLATQALQNRQALMGMGQSLLQQERNFRLSAANRQTTGSSTQQGGFGDVLGAGLAGAGAIAKLKTAFG